MAIMNGKYRYTAIQNDPELFVKLPKNLLADLQKSARENGRTLNTELIIRLGRTFNHSDLTEIENDMLKTMFPDES